MYAEKALKGKGKREIKELYETSFPKEERMPFIVMLLMSCLRNTQFFAFYEEKLVWIDLLGYFRGANVYHVFCS